LEKIVLSRELEQQFLIKKLIDYAVDELTKITGRSRFSTISKKVASFKLKVRIGQKLLCVERMYEF
jgi:large subunit ribosomal protein L5